MWGRRTVGGLSLFRRCLKCVAGALGCSGRWAITFFRCSLGLCTRRSSKSFLASRRCSRQPWLHPLQLETDAWGTSMQRSKWRL